MNNNKPPCDACVADGVIRGTMCGAVWGALRFSDKIAGAESGDAAAGIQPEPSTARPAWQRFAPRLLRNSAALYPRAFQTFQGAGMFAVFLGVFSGVGCVVDRAAASLNAPQWAGYGVGGFVAGLLVSPWKGTSWAVRVRTAGICGVIAGSVTYFVGGPIQHPRGGAGQR